MVSIDKEGCRNAAYNAALYVSDSAKSVGKSVIQKTKETLPTALNIANLSSISAGIMFTMFWIKEALLDGLPLRDVKSYLIDLGGLTFFCMIPTTIAVAAMAQRTTSVKPAAVEAQSDSAQKV